MKNILLPIYFLFIIPFAEAEFYRFDPHGRSFSRELSQFFDPVFNKGRMQIYRIKKKRSFEGFPRELLGHLVKIKKDEWKVIGPDKLNKKTPSSLSIQSTLDEISEKNIRGHLEFLVGRETRKMGSVGNRESEKYIEQFLEKHQYKVEKGCFKKRACNVLGIKEGELDEYVLVLAHFDSVGALRAGADDNASGAAGLLEMARLLSKKRFKRGVIIFATNGEEDGLLGSKHFVKKAESSGLLAKISFFINMDMISWNKNGIVDIETNREFEGVARWMSSIANTYTNLRPEITMPAWGSDHVPFLKKGVPGVLTIEHWKTKSPCYHQLCDKLDTLNIPYLIEILKLNMASSLFKLDE